MEGGGEVVKILCFNLFLNYDLPTYGKNYQLESKRRIGKLKNSIIPQLLGVDFFHLRGSQSVRFQFGKFSKFLLNTFQCFSNFTIIFE